MIFRRESTRKNTKKKSSCTAT